MVDAVAAGDAPLNHVLAFEPFCSSANPVYPASVYQFTHSCAGQGHNDTYDIPPGGRIWWNESCATVKNRSIDDASKVILCTLNKFGALAMDTNGSDGFQFRLDDMPFVTANGSNLPDFVTSVFGPGGIGSNVGGQYGSTVYGLNGMTVYSNGKPLSAADVNAHLFLLNNACNQLPPAGNYPSC
jgi:hypothetical protein